MSLQLQIKRFEPDVVVVELSGKIAMGPDTFRLEEEVRRLLDRRERKLILDLTAVEAIDSTGVGALVRCHLAATGAGGGLRLAGAPDRVAETLRVTRLDQVLPCDADVAAACKSFGLTPEPEH